MADELDELKVTVRLDDKMTGPMKKAAESVGKFSNGASNSLKGLAGSVGGAAKSISGFAKVSNVANKSLFSLRGQVLGSIKDLGRMARVLGPVALALAAFSKITGQLASLDGLGKTADRLGITTQALQQLRFAAEKSGLEVNTLDMALQRMVRRLAQAKSGSGEAVSALNALGLSAQEMSKLSPDEQLKRIADAMNGLGSESEKVAVAFKLFDSEGVKMVNLLGEGSAGLSKMMNEARGLGLTISREQAAAVEKANDSMLRFNTTTSVAAALMATELAPEIEAGAELLLKLAEGYSAASREQAAFARLQGEDLKSAQKLQDKISRMLPAQRKEFIQELNETINSARQTGDLDGLSQALKTREQVITQLIKELQNLPMDDPSLLVSKAMTVVGEQADGSRQLLAFAGQEATTLGEIFQSLGIQLDGYIQKTEELNRTTADGNTVIATQTGEYLAAAQVIERLRNAQNSLRSEKAATIEQAKNEGSAVSSLGERWKEYLITTSNGLREQAIALNFAGAAMDEYKERFTEQAFQQQVNSLEQSKINQMATLEFYNQYEKDIVAQKQRDLELQEKDHQAQLQAIWNQGQQAKLAVASQVFGNLSTLMQSENKKLFEIGKRAAQAQAIVDTWAAANAAMDETPGPYWVKLAAAASIAVAGLVNVARIEKTQFGGGKSSGGGGQAAGGAGGTAQPATQGQGQQGENPSGGRGMINVSIQGERFGQSQVRDMMGELGEAISDNYDMRMR